MTTTNHHSEPDWRGYYDEKQPLIYVAGPYSAPTKEGVEENIRRACAARDKLIAVGWSVICPHANTAWMDNEDPDVFYRMDLTQVARCDAIYLLEGYGGSVGAMIERKFAGELQRRGKPMAILTESFWSNAPPCPMDYKIWKASLSEEQPGSLRTIARRFDDCVIKDVDMKEFGMQDETVTNEHGGKQSKIEHRLSLLPPEALLRVGAILTTGAAKYGDDNWRLISQRDHLDHALRHIVKHLSGDTTEDHLGNAACRLLFAISDLCVDVVIADAIEEGDE